MRSKLLLAVLVCGFAIGTSGSPAQGADLAGTWKQDGTLMRPNSPFPIPTVTTVQFTQFLNIYLEVTMEAIPFIYTGVTVGPLYVGVSLLPLPFVGLDGGMVDASGLMNGTT